MDIDFKQRFQGKTSHITKEGVIDNIMGERNANQPVLREMNESRITNKSNLVAQRYDNPRKLRANQDYFAVDHT